MSTPDEAVDATDEFNVFEEYSAPTDDGFGVMGQGSGYSPSDRDLASLNPLAGLSTIGAEYMYGQGK